MSFKTAYLPVEYLGEGDFSTQRVVRIQDSSGNFFEGLFQEEHMKGNSGLRVNVIDERGDEAFVQVPHGEHYGIYGNGLDAGSSISVRRDCLCFE